MSKEELLSTTYRIGEDTYTIGEMMYEMQRASSQTVALFWCFHLDCAIRTFEEATNELRRDIHSMMEEKVPAALSVAAVKGLSGMKAPQQLSPNHIFKGKVGECTVDMNKLWLWINNTMLPRMHYGYEWLALLLFASHHHLLLKDDTKSFSEQMSSWFPDAAHPCTHDQVNLYRRGFFRDAEKFDYFSWIRLDIPIPKDYIFTKSQHAEGFKRIHSLCLALEAADYSEQIYVQNTNK